MGMDEMDGYVYSKAVSPASVRAFLARRQDRLDYIMQESASNISFERFTTPGEDWLPWEMGRAFGESIEVRWQRLEDNIFQMLTLSEVPQEDIAREGWRERVIEAESGVKVYLWGRHCSFLVGAEGLGECDYWVQASIPRRLHYPLKAREKFAYIEVVEYRDRERNMIVLTRFRRVDGETRKEGE